LQSEFVDSLREQGIEIPRDLSTLVYIKNSNVLVKSTAVLKIAAQLKGIKWMRVLLWVPRFIRDFFYSLIARFRKKLAKPYCHIPNEEQKKQFIN